MKPISNIENTKRRDGLVRRVLGVTAVGAFAAAPFIGLIATSEAKPPSHAPAWGYRRKQDNDKNYRNRRNQRSRYDRNRNSRDNRYDRNRRNDRNNRDRRDDRWNRNNNYRTYTGTVTGVSRDRFDIRAGGSTYNVRPNGGVPRGMSRGDTVRVYGVRSGNNDIVNANVNLIRRR